MKFHVQILGSNSAFPAFGRFPSAQILNHNEELFLIDCGEGTQMQMTRFHVKRSKIQNIFISHLHGDHVFGLPGLITSYTQLGREKAIHLYGPVGIQELIETVLVLSGSRIKFEIKYTELSHRGDRMIFSNPFLEIRAFPLRHRIETYGYVFKEKQRPLRMRKDMIEKYQLTTEQILDAKSGSDLTINRIVVPVEELTHPPDLQRSYAYCSDTSYDESLLSFIKNVDVLYHETTFMSDLAELAKLSQHSTAVDAAMMAKKANAGYLITGHYSSRYKELGPLLKEAKQVFPTAELGLEGRVYEIGR